MTIDEAIEHERELVKVYRCVYECECDFYGSMFVHDNSDRFDCNKDMQEHEQLAEWLEELKYLREYKERMEMQYLDDIDNPLEPLKLQSALQSEIFKFNYRKEHRPQDINILDYTVMYALKHCLEEQLKE